MTRAAREGLSDKNKGKRMAYVRETYRGCDLGKVGVPGEEAEDMKKWRLKVDPRLVLFMDESGFNLMSTVPNRARSKRGTPAVMATRYVRGKNNSLLPGKGFFFGHRYRGELPCWHTGCS